MVINTERLKQFADGLWEKIKENYIHKHRENILNNTLTVRELKVKSDVSINRYSGSSNRHVASSTSVFGHPNATVPANVVVSRLAVAVVGYNVGEKVENINVFTVRPNDNILIEHLIVNGTGYVVNNYDSYFDSDCNTLEIEIQQSFSEEVYFLVGCGKVGSKGQAIYSNPTSATPLVGVEMIDGSFEPNHQFDPQPTSKTNAMKIHANDLDYSDHDVKWVNMPFVDHKNGGNLFDKNKLIRDQLWTTTDNDPVHRVGWGVYYSDFEVRPGDEFIYRDVRSSYVILLDKNRKKIDILSASGGIVKIPNDERITGFALNVDIDFGSDNSFMIYRGTELPQNYEPYSGDEQVIFRPERFVYRFNNGGLVALGDDLGYAVRLLGTMILGAPYIGEFKQLAQDEGETIEINGRTWLRCDGQQVSSVDYKELYNAIGNNYTNNQSARTTDVGGDIDADFNLPTNPLGVGYLYICVK